MVVADDDAVDARVAENVHAASHDELLQMLEARPDEYTAFALGVARQELARRGGEQAVRQQIADREAQENIAERKARRQAPRIGSIGECQDLRATRAQTTRIMLCDYCQKDAHPTFSRTWIMARQLPGFAPTPNPRVIERAYTDFKPVTASICRPCYQIQKGKINHRACIDLAFGCGLVAVAAVVYLVWDVRYPALGIAIMAAIFLLRALVIPFGEPGILYLVDRATDKAFPSPRGDHAIAYWTPEEYEKIRDSA